MVTSYDEISDFFPFFPFCLFYMNPNGFTLIQSSMVLGLANALGDVGENAA
jgi:hypothetical protein